MITIKRKTFLKDAPDYEDYTENIATLSNKEKEELGIKVCNGCCKNKNKK